MLSKWVKENPLGMHENLFAMKAYAPYHHLYAVSLFFATCNAISGEFMIDPKLALQKLEDAKMLDYVVTMAGNCLNMAFINASAERQAANKMFTSQNWVKSSQSLRDIRSAVSSTISTMKLIPSNKDAYLQLAQALKCNREDFLPRWTAD